MSEPSPDRWIAVDRYIDDTLVSTDDALEAAIASSHAAGLPSIAVSPSQGKLLFVLAKAMGARRILELGTLGGYSAIWLARALPADGRLVTIEFEPKHADVARRNLERAGVAPQVDLRVGPALDVLPQIESEKLAPFDFVFIDADKTNYANYYEACLPMLRPGGILAVDNTLWSGWVADRGHHDDDTVALRKFNDKLHTDDRVEIALLPLGDGVTLALKK